MSLKRFLAFSLLGLFVAPHLRAEPATLPAQGVLERLMPHLAPQFELRIVAKPDQKDYFRIEGTKGHIVVQAATQPTLLYGVNWYLKYVAHLQVSPNGSQLGGDKLILPGPSAPIEKPVLYPWRFALNETVDGYSAPYWDDQRWQQEIDLLAISGINAVLFQRGTEMVLYQTFHDAGYSDDAIRRWIVQPAHLGWELMGNMCCFGEPISMELLKSRSASAKKLIARMRSLGITPVLPGYYGMVPADFAKYKPNAHVINQGEWVGFARPGWLDPRDPEFGRLAESFYRHQRNLYGDSTIYDMEVFQEGGTPGDVPVGAAAKKVQDALELTHPGALWMLLAWADNPAPELLAGTDTGHLLVNDIEQARIPREDRDREFRGASWLFGGLWEFGGRTTLGGSLYDYAVRFPRMANKPGSHIAGTAISSEGVDTNPFAFELYTEMAWHEQPVDLVAWTDAYAIRRYGAYDAHAQRAWQILLKTAYSLRADGNLDHGERDGGPESLFNAEPSLTTKHASTWAPDALRYDAGDFAVALTELLQVAPALRDTQTYQYDLVDVARQAMANESRAMLPEIDQAFKNKDEAAFARLTARWLHRMQLQDDLLATNQSFLLGRWLAYVPTWASSPDELARLNYDARSILTTWGDRHASETGLHDYGNRDWAGLTADYYLPRWKLFFDSLSTALRTGEPPKKIDWYALGDKWNRSHTPYGATPRGSAYRAARAIAEDLAVAPRSSSGDEPAVPAR